MGTMLVIYIVEIEMYVYMFDRECIWSIREQVIKPTMQQEATSGEILSLDCFKYMINIGNLTLLIPVAVINTILAG